MRKIVKCSFCGYEWFSISPNFKVSCPNCQAKVRINENNNEKKCEICGKYRILSQLVEKEGKYYHKKCLKGIENGTYIKN